MLQKSQQASSQIYPDSTGAEAACIHCYSKNHTSLQSDFTQFCTAQIPTDDGYLQKHRAVLRSEPCHLSLPTSMHACDALKGPRVWVTRAMRKWGSPNPATAVSRFTNSGCPSLTISCSEASAPPRRSSGRCSSFSGGCSTHGPEGFRAPVSDYSGALS